MRNRSPFLPWRIPLDVPLTFGHENIGVVHEIGSAVTSVKVGDRVVVSVADFKEDPNADLQTVASFGIGGVPGLTELNGGQAQFMRVPNADANFLVLPEGDERELDYILLADIWPTAWFGLDRAEMVFGDTVVIFGAGPVGLLAAYSAKLRGAIRVYSVDHVPERLARAKSIGAIPINFAQGDPVQQILNLEPNGVDRSVDCCGFECVNASGENVENLVISQAIAITRPYGGIGVIGIYPTVDLGASSTDTKKGVLSIPFGDLWLKSLSLKTGFFDDPTYKQLQLLLKNLIERDNAKPSFVFDKEFRIEQAQEAFTEFSEHKLVKAVFRFGNDVAASGEELKSTNSQDPLKGKPVTKRTQRSYEK